MLQRTAAAAARFSRGARATATRAMSSRSAAESAHDGSMGARQAGKDSDPVVVRTGTSGRSVEFNRPKALNALNLDMIDRLTPVVMGWEAFRADYAQKLAPYADPDVDTPNTMDGLDKHSTIVDAAPVAAVFYGAGGKSFCAGGDILALYNNGKDPQRRARTHDFFAREYRLNHLLGTTDVPIISVLNGITMGGGVGLSVHGKVRVATERTLFAMPETGIGFFPDVGGGYFLPRLPHSGLGMYLALTGARLKGAEALAAGVATRYMPVDRLSHLEQAVRHDMYRGAATSEKQSDAAAQHMLDEYCVEPPEEAAAKLVARLPAIERCFSDDSASVEDCVAHLAREASKGGSPRDDADAKWAHDTLKLLSRASPTAMKVTFEQLRRGGGRHGGTEGTDLGAVLAMEYRVAVRFMEAQQGSDFFEGVRALLVDKDNAPNWAAAPYDGPLRTLANADAGPDALAGALADALEDVADADVATYFSPLAERDGVDVGELELLQRPFTRPQGSTLPAANA